MGSTPTPSSHPRPLRVPFLAALLALAASLAFTATAGAVLSGGYGYQRRELPALKAEPLQYHGGPVLHSSDAYTIYWDPTETYRGEWKQLINGYMQNVGADRTSGDVFALNGQYGDSGGSAANVSTFRGSYTDKDAYPTSGCTEPAAFACLTDAQIRAELQHVVSSGALPGATGPGVYYLLTPPGVVVCTDTGGNGNCSDSTTSKPSNGICGYHSAINPGAPGQVIYAVQPWVAGEAGKVESQNPLVTVGPTEEDLACQANAAPLVEPNQLGGPNLLSDYMTGLPDILINDLSVEQSNIVVDPLLNGWYQTATGAEQGDMCQENFGPPPTTAPTPEPYSHAANISNETINGHPYYIQWAFDSTWLTNGKGYFCWQGDNLTPRFTAPNPINVGDVAGFDGTESLITLQAAAGGLPADEPYVAPIYSWNFGDGTSLSGTTDESVFHTFQYGGSYEVTLTVTDSARQSASFAQTITVDGPPRPGSSPSTSGGDSTPAAGGSSNPNAVGVPPAAGTTGPVAATAAVAPQSLASALKSGLVVRYSVNGRAAGRFEVLLAKSVAKKIGLKGGTATGLAKGTPPQIVIAKAILVTTKAGHSSYRIKFSKATAAKLRKLHKVSLMIRLVVHNASSPVTTTVLSTATLAH
ncbi:MAG TPA: PKD domain-containing protein [Solirubrobacteraceae bacterium]|nr:PKD domain-containing protein [Solirubrobacteraceae bacterium]